MCSEGSKHHAYFACRDLLSNPPPSNAHTHNPFIFKVFHLCIDMLMLGFELDLYAPHEYHMILWYTDHQYKWLHSLYKGAHEQRRSFAAAALSEQQATAKKGGKKKKPKKKGPQVSSAGLVVVCASLGELDNACSSVCLAR